jgi:glucosyl-3-phosphoglycerate synthase
LFHAGQFGVPALAAGKGATRVSVCLPARNEAATIGPIVTAIRRELMDDVLLVDELLVLDDHSDDGTAEVAEAAGATVFDAASTLPDEVTGHGKGQALWKSLYASTGDVVVWCDSDISDFDTSFITGILGPLLEDPGISFVKGFYARTDDGIGGGRVTELVARPLLALLFPELGGVIQPLSGEFGGRRSVLEQLPFATGYGVDLGLLLDVFRLFGPAAIAQVDLGSRRHRHRTLEELGPQALAVMQIALRRRGLAMPETAALLRPGLEPTESTFSECPALIDIPAYRRRTA